jgi:hypothetical protein
MQFPSIKYPPLWYGNGFFPKINIIMHLLFKNAENTLLLMKFHPKTLNFYMVLYLIHVYQYHTVTKKEEHPECFQAPCHGPPWTQNVLSEAQSVFYFPDLLQLEGFCVGPHNATCDHTEGEYEPHASQHNTQLGPWPHIEISTVHRYSQTPRTNTKRLHKLNFLSFISWKSPRQHKLPYFRHHLICPIVPGSEARVCQLLIATEEKN